MNVADAFAIALEHHQAGRLAEAEMLYRQILAADPRHIEARHHLGLLASLVGRNDLAIRWIREVIAVVPNHFAAHSNLAEIQRSMGRTDEAITSFQRALEIQPDHPGTRNNLGLALLAKRLPSAAEAQFRRVIELEPGHAIAHHNLGIALTRQRQFDEAIAAERRALALQPDYAEAWCNLGSARDEKGQKEDALTAYRRALELKPGYADAWNNLGSAQSDLGQYEEAGTAYRQALRFQPDHKCAEYNLSLVLLLRGDFEEGLPLQEARWEALEYPPRPFPQPRWQGGPLAAQRLLIHAEQGLGDSIHFIRYAPLVAARAGGIIVECHPQLLELFRTVLGVREVVAMGEALPLFDAHVPMLSLPLAFQTSLATIPSEVPYLSADPTRREEWRERLGLKQSCPRIGIAWAGNPEKERLRKRHIPLASFAPLLDLEDFEFFSLQVGPGAEQLRQLPESSRITDHAGHIRDFADTAALISELDLVITVDTAVAHLAGALGKPVWTLLPFVPDWRWGLNSETTPWYPTMRLFRQPALGDWETAIQQVVTALRGLTAS